MKRITLFFLSFALVGLFATSCTEEEVQPSFDESLIIGKWQSGTLFEKYKADKSGATWDTSDDVAEDEAQEFTWSIEKDQLEQIHIIVGGGVTPRVYTITVLTASTLRYKDEKSGKTTTFSKL